jgi:predicted acylesterase/phospholipase RssA
MSVQFCNLIFEGGGVKGIAYVGAMQVLEQRGILKNIKRVGGASAGAMNALLFALGFDIPSQRKILEHTDFKEFMDDSFGMIRDIRRLAKLFGYHKGDFFSGWVADLILKPQKIMIFICLEQTFPRDIPRYSPLSSIPICHLRKRSESACRFPYFSLQNDMDHVMMCTWMAE